ncbi:MAG: phage holin family protein [Chloroflexia bacterium]|nr:phage holin family protein [Chloroflexia bacterium]
MGWRSIKRIAGLILLQAALLLLLAWMLPGFWFSDPLLVIPAALAITAAQSLLWPFMYGVASRFGPIFFPVLSFVLTGVLIYLAAQVEEVFGIGGVEVASIWTGLLIALGLSVGNTILAAVFSINDDRTYDRLATAPLRRRYRHAERTDEPGFLFLEIDGLSEPVLLKAMAAGDMPTLKRWLDEGSHRLMQWDPDLSSQTSASQAGILLGSNEGIPAFRWWDKPRQQLMVSSKMNTAHELELQLSTGNGLLANGGAARWNAFSGNAADSIGVFSVFGDASRGSDNTVLGFLFSPYLLSRILTLYVVDVFREWWQSWQQRRQDIRPRISRPWKYAFVRSGTTTAMQEASRALLTADILRGAPEVYNTFFGYDEVAHHSGILSPDSMKVLRTLDHVIAHLERITREAPRPYFIFVLSDHGQSEGATFEQIYGVSLGDVVQRLIEPHRPTRLTEISEDDEAMGHVNAALSDVVQGDSTTARTVRRLLRKRTSDGQVSLARGDAALPQPSPGVTDVMVLASGNLGVISFPEWKNLMTLEELDAAFPALVPGLVDHPGVSLALVTSAAHGPLAIGKGGVYYLETDKVEGQNPIARFGPHAARHLLREAKFVNVPDIVVIGEVNEQTGEVPAFEDKLGNHGGLGGWQREPFVLYPVEFTPQVEEIVGAAHLHDVLMQWMAESRAKLAAKAEQATPAA